MCLPEKSSSARDSFASKINLAVRSTEFCQCSLDERNIRIRLGGSCGHGVLKPLRCHPREAFHLSQLFKAFGEIQSRNPEQRIAGHKQQGRGCRLL